MFSLEKRLNELQTILSKQNITTQSERDQLVSERNEKRKSLCDLFSDFEKWTKNDLETIEFQLKTFTPIVVNLCKKTRKIKKSKHKEKEYETKFTQT